MAAYALAMFPNPEINLSAFGALLIAICFFFQSTTWNLLGTSASLVRSREDLQVLIRFLNIMCVVMALIFLIFVISPLSGLILVPLFGSTQELYDLTLPSLIMGSSWPFLVGYRRINQGVLIHVSLSKLVSLTSITRIIALAVSLMLALYLAPPLSGITTVSICLTIAVIVETTVSHFLVAKYGISRLPESKTQLTIKSTWKFCMPMVLAAIVSQLMLPLGSAILFRLPQPQLSLVVWPALTGLLQLIRTIGFSVIELTASIGDNPLNRSAILKFSNRSSVCLFLFLSCFVITGVGGDYFRFFGGLESDYAEFAAATLAFGLFYPSIEIRLWYLTGAAYAVKATEVTAQATVVAVAIGFVLYAVGLHQSQISGAAFLLLILTICTLAEIGVFSLKLSKKL